MRGAAVLLAVLSLTGCDRMITPRSTQVTKDAEEKASAGEYLDAINLYESALDGTAASADVHYQLALLYDEKMKEPLMALHHFKRYLTLVPTGSRAEEAKKFMKRGELELVTNLSGDALVTRAEAARLRNENLSLRKTLAERATPARVTASTKAEAKKNSASTTPRSHTVEAGDTLFSLSRKYYDSPDRWKDILKANKKSVDDPGKLQLGQKLTIP